MADQDFKIKNGLRVGNGTLVINSAGDWSGNTIAVSKGGTGATAVTQGGVVFGSSTTTYGSTALGTSGQLLQSAGSGTPTWIDATDVPTVSTIVKRDAAGRFAAVDPSASDDVATKQYVDNLVQGLDVKASVKFATTADLGTVTYANGTSGVGATLTKTTTFATLSIDGLSPVVGDRILVKDQSNQAQNGIYTVTNIGSGSTAWVLTRATDMDTAAKLPGAFTFVEQGTANYDTGWVCTTDSGATVGTTNIVFSKFAGVGTYSAGTGLTLTGTTFSVDAGTIAAGTLAVARGGTGVTTSTGSGSVVLSTSPSLTTPTLGVATATSVNKVAITAPATSATLTIADTKTLTVNNNLTFSGTDGKTLTVSNTLTFSGTDGSTVAFGTGGTVAYTANKLSAFAATTSAELAGIISDETGTGALVFANTPTLVSPVLGTPTSGTLTNCTGLPVSTGISGLGTGVATFLATPSSANLLSAITGETGTGALVFGTSPSLGTPALSGETFSTSAAVTAGTNAQGQSALTSDYNVVTTAASNPSGVTLPAATTGRRVVVINKGANAVNVYPASGGTIDALAANAAISIPVNSGMEFNASSTTQWYSSFNYSTSGSMVSGNISGNAANVTGTVAAGNGGTGQSSYAVGDLLYASAATTLSKLAAVASGSVLISNGVTTAPSWSASPSLTSLTLSGALTVDTNTLVVDAANNRVGIGTATPSTTLHVVGDIGGTGALTRSSIELSSSAPFIDFHANSSANDYEARIMQDTDYTLRFASRGSFLFCVPSGGANPATDNTVARIQFDTGGPLYYYPGGSNSANSWVIWPNGGQESTSRMLIGEIWTARGSVLDFRTSVGSAYSTLFASGVNPSDIKLKTDVKPIAYGLSDIQKLKPVSFRYTAEPDKEQLGFVAQDVQAVLPEVVSSSNDVLGIAYNGIVAALTNAVKELSAQVDELKAKMAAHGIE